MDASQRRQELLARLAKLDPPSAEECFVLLWSYLDLGRIVEAENFSHSGGVHHFRIEPHPLGKDHRKGLAAAVSRLEDTPAGRFELLCAQVLLAVDSVLSRRQPERVSQLGAIPDLDGQSCRVRRRNNFLSTTLGSRITTQRDQSGTIDLYAPAHISVPDTRSGIAIESLLESSWGNRQLHRRLQAERNRLRVMLWPLTSVPDYPALKEEPRPELFVLETDANEEALTGDVTEAIRCAREQRVTLLIFPELAMPPATQTAIRQILAAERDTGFPILTLFGCCHCRLAKGNCTNEAALVDWEGTEVAKRHRKIAKFSRRYAESAFFGERIESGKSVLVFESAFGNLTPLICLDFFHEGLAEVVSSSHANVFAVPSLSPKTNAHLGRAKALQAHNLSSAFVCNRTLAGPSAAAPSFYHVPASKEDRRLRLHPASTEDGSSCLVFSLEEELDKSGS